MKATQRDLVLDAGKTEAHLGPRLKLFQSLYDLFTVI